MQFREAKRLRQQYYDHKIKHLRTTVLASGGIQYNGSLVHASPTNA